MAAPGGVFVRRAEFDDQQAIQALIGDDASLIGKRFGAFDVTMMIETASLGITAVNEKGEVVGYAAFYDHPVLSPEVDAAAWPAWLHAHFGHPEYTSATAVWLAFFIADHLCQNEVAESILRTAFTTLFEADAILFALPDDVRTFAPIRDTFEPLQCLKPDATKLRVHACHRSLYLPDLLIRQARVEDHDDLVPVFNAQSEVLTERYGEFFIAELIERQDEGNTALVAEVDGHAIGLLALSAEIDVKLLQQTFDLKPYGNLERQQEDAPMLLNAFCVSVFCMDDSFESRSADFLTAAFAAFPDRQYCVLTLPHTTAEFSLVNAFTQAEALPSSSFGHMLYLFHRDALGGARSLAVRPANVIDSKAVSDLVSELSEYESIKRSFDEATGPPPPAGAPPRTKVAYVAECVGQPVGLVVLDEACNVTELQAQYALEDFVLFSEHSADAHAYLDAFVVNPIFARNSRWVLKEVFRQHKRSCLYLKLKDKQPVPTVLSEFVQCKPRRLVEPSPALLSELNEQREQLGLPPRHSEPADRPCYFLTRKLLSEPKIVNNSRIVVFGASDAALAFLEGLISVPYLHFSSIVLVAPRAGDRLAVPRGHAVNLEDARMPTPFFARSGGYTKAELKALGLGARVKLVDSQMVDIDRQAKVIMLPEGSVLPYDYLVIAPEFGDQTLYGIKEAARLRGAFSLFDENADRALQDYMFSTFDQSSGRVMVFGGSLDAYSTIQAMISRGIPPANIELVSPPPSVDEDIFAHPRVRAKVEAQLAALGVTCAEKMRVVGLEADDSGVLSSVLLEATESATRVSRVCQLLVCVGPKEVERSTFDALNGASIVYDGRLVVDSKFCTNDKAVYAAGVITKFSRRYRSKLQMATVSGRECGAKLAQAVLPILDPLSASSSLEAEAPVPTFDKPKVATAVLPGPLHYVSIVHPTPGCETYIKAKAHASFGRELVTDDGEDTYTFCSVRLDKNGVIRALTYLGTSPIEDGNWASLIGLPESALNNLAPRFDEGIVTDLPAFLRQNWAVALYHDRFSEFQSVLRAELEGDDKFKEAMEALRERAEYDANKLAPGDLMNLLPEEKRNLVRTRVLDYVASNQNQLDMYLVPSSAIMSKMEASKIR